MKDLKVSHPTEAMAGKLAGVQVQQVGGQPGQAATIRVRGSGSITHPAPRCMLSTDIRWENKT